MFTQTTTEKKSTTVLIPEPSSIMPWRVASVDVVDAQTLHVSFLDGTRGHVSFATSFFEGFFEGLKNQTLFNRAYVQCGAVTWPGAIDLAPDAMYAAIKAQGVCVLT